MTINTRSAQLKNKPAGEGKTPGKGQMAEKQVVVKTFRFGELVVDRKLVITIPKGILGFVTSHRYVVVETPDSEPFKWLQSLDDPALAFVIVNPLVFFADYRIDVDRRELEELKITDPASVITHVIVSIPDGDMSEMSANLQGPILINMENNLAKQLVLVNGPYTIRHPLLKQVTEQPAGEPHGAKTETNAG